MLKVSIHNALNKRGLAMVNSSLGEMPMVIDPIREFSVFQSVTHTTSATTVMAIPSLGQSLRLVDLVISAEKIAGGIVTVRFNDAEANIENIYVGHASDNIVDFSWAPAGRIHGWADAWIEFITTTLNQDATCLIGYTHVDKDGSLEYSEWNGLR
jgi:hypothetical protein